MRRSIGHPRLIAVVFLSLIVMPILSGWTGDVIRDWLKGDEVFVHAPLAGGWLLAFSVVGLSVAFVGVVVLGRRLLPVRVLFQSLQKTTTAKHRPALVIPISPPSEGFERREDGWYVGQERLSGDIETDCLPRTDRKFWNWQQMLRGLRHNRVDSSQPMYIVLIGSSGQRGSFLRLHDCRDFLAGYLPASTRFHLWPESVDFEDIDKLSAAMSAAIEYLRQSGYGDEQILIDCTGGHKTTSIAAALVTLSSPQLMFQYVGNDGTVSVFNVVAENFHS